MKENELRTCSSVKPHHFVKDKSYSSSLIFNTLDTYSCLRYLSSRSYYDVQCCREANECVTDEDFIFWYCSRPPRLVVRKQLRTRNRPAAE